MTLRYPGRQLTAAEARQHGLTRNTLLIARSELQRHELRGQYRWSADRGDNPNYRGLLDRIKVDRNEGYEVLHFVNQFCFVLGISARADGLKIERLLHSAPSNMVMRDDLQNWVWTRLVGGPFSVS